MTNRDRIGEPEVPVAKIIKLFGGIRPMANKLDVPVSTVQGWKERTAIPANRHDEILAAARRHKVDLPPELLKLSDQEGEQAAAESSPETPTKDVGPENSLETTASDEAAEEASSADLSSTFDTSPTAPPPPQSEPQSSMSSLYAGIALGAIILALGAGGAVASRDAWLPLFGQSPAAPSTSSETVAALSALKNRIAALESSGSQKVDALAASVEKLSGDVKKAGGGQVTAKALSDVTASIESLKGRVAGLESSSQAASSVNTNEISSLSGTQQSLANRLAGIEQEVGAVGEMKQELGRLTEKLTDIRQSANSDGAILLAGLQLRDAVRGSEPFEAQYEALQALSRKDENLAAIIAPLKPFAASGVATLEELRAAFPPVASEVVAVERGSDAGEGWISGAVRRFSEVVTVRPVGLVDGDGPGSAVARAEFHLNSGDLAAAVKELDGLSPDAAAVAADWRAKADARLTVNKALAGVADLVASRLSKLGD